MSAPLPEERIANALESIADTLARIFGILDCSAPWPVELVHPDDK